MRVATVPCLVQTIKESADLVLTSATSTDVTCHGGSNGSASVNYQGGVGPYEENWYGFDPSSLEAGTYSYRSQTTIFVPLTPWSSSPNLHHLPLLLKP